MTEESARLYDAQRAESIRVYEAQLAESIRLYDAQRAESIRAYEAQRAESIRAYEAQHTSQNWAETLILRTGYRAAAMANHPDRGGSHERMIAINAAHAALKARGK